MEEQARKDLIEKAERTHRLSPEELAALLADAEAEEELAAAADRVRHAFVGDEVHLRGLIEFSSYCRQNCLYCGLRRDNGKAQRYRLSPEEIVALAAKAKAYGYFTAVMQSGEDPWFTAERLAAIVREVKKLGLAVTLSVGERTKEEYRVLREAGADRFLLRIETTDKDIYEALDPGMSHENRIRCLADLKALGYEVGTGCLIGLPGQTAETLARDILFFQEIDADMVGVGPLVPNEDTPLGGEQPGDMHLVRRVVGATRLLLPEANIPATNLDIAVSGMIAERARMDPAFRSQRRHAQRHRGRGAAKIRALSGQGLRRRYAGALPRLHGGPDPRTGPHGGSGRGRTAARFVIYL